MSAAPKTRGRQRVGLLAPTSSAAQPGSATGSPVTVRVEPSRSATQACVVVAIPFRVNHWVLEALRAGAPSALHDAALFDQSVAAYAAYEAVEEKLRGTTVDAIKNKVVDSRCGGQGGEFLVSVTCAPTLASARKCAGIVLQQLRWGSLYQRYSTWCKVLGVRPDKAAYARAAEVANKATLGGITIVITGKVQADAAGAQRTADLLARKIKNAPPKEEGRARTVALSDVENAGAPVSSLYTAYPAAGLDGVIALNFVESNIRGEVAHLASGALYIPDAKSAQAKRFALGDKAEKYAASLLRLKAEARPALVFIAAKECYVGAADLVAGGPALTEGGVAAAIRATFA